jgi:hypothetical protein
MVVVVLLLLLLLLEIKGRIKILPVCHALPPLHNPGSGIDRGHGGKGRFHLEPGIKRGLRGCRKIVEGSRLEVGCVGVEAHEGWILNELREVRSRLLLSLQRE